MNQMEYHKELCNLFTELNNLRMRIIKEEKKIELMEEYKSLAQKYVEMDRNYLLLVEDDINKDNESNNEIKDNLSFVSDSTINTIQLGLFDKKEKKEKKEKKKEKKINITTTAPKSTNKINQNNPKTTFLPKSFVNHHQNRQQNKPKMKVNHNNNVNNNNQKNKKQNNKKFRKINIMENNSVNIHENEMKSAEKMNQNFIANSAPKNRNFDNYNAFKYKFYKPVYSPTKLYLSAKPKIEKNKHIFYEWTESKVVRILGRYGISQPCIRRINIIRNNYVLIMVVQPISVLNKNIKKLSNIKYCGHHIICEKYKKKQNNNNNNNYYYYENYENQSLFLTGFDITTDANFYQKFEKFFLCFGNISKIHIAADRNNYPFAIVRFKKLDDSIDCFQSIRRNQSKFGEKLLNVSYHSYAKEY